LREFHNTGTGGQRREFDRVVRKTLLRVSTITGLAILVASILVLSLPVMVGNEFSHAKSLSWSLMPALGLRALHFTLGDALSGLGGQNLRFGLSLSTAMTSIPCYVFFIRNWGTWGAVLATYTVEGTLFVLFVVTLAIMRKRLST
jgi:O-antigen/teichoic acid export membrane protein